MFGPEFYSGNLERMREEGYNPTLTQESIAMVADGFGENGEFDAKRDILDRVSVYR